MPDAGQMLEMLRDARWDGIVLLARSFWTAALTHPWMWVVVALATVTVGRMAILRLIRFVGGSFVGHELRYRSD